MNKKSKIILIVASVLMAIVIFLNLINICGSRNSNSSGVKKLRALNIHETINTDVIDLALPSNFEVDSSGNINVRKYKTNTGSLIVGNAYYIQLQDASDVNILSLANVFYLNFYCDSVQASGMSDYYNGFVSYSVVINDGVYHITDTLNDTYLYDLSSNYINIGFVYTIGDELGYYGSTGSSVQYTSLPISLNPIVATCTLNDIPQYAQAYTNGYGDGYDDGVFDGTEEVIINPNNYDLYTEAQYIAHGHDRYQVGYSVGVGDGYDVGYDDGYDQGTSDDVMTNGFKDLVNTILSSPYNTLHGMFNFEFLGINLFNLVSFIFTTMFVLLIFKIFKSK